MANRETDLEATRDALSAVKLFRGHYGSQPKFFELADEVCRVLEDSEDTSGRMLRSNIAAAIRKSYRLDRKTPSNEDYEFDRTVASELNAELEE